MQFSEGELIIKKYLLFALLILGLTLSLGVYGVSAAAVGPADISNSNLTQYEGPSSTSAVTQNNTTRSSTVSNGVSSTAPRKAIKVLIYNGDGTITSCVNGVKTGLNNANNNFLVPGYRFTYATTRTINSAVLSGYDVLVMPGGSSGKNYINTISGSVIKKFVASGHGYLGICAGAYSGSKYVSGMYNGWGVAPHVYCKHITHEGNLQVSILQSGSKLFGSSGTVTLAHYNGPVMYAYGGSIVTFATYTDNHIGYKGYGAIVGDYYVKGRAVLSGPHPELDPQNPSILSKLIAWAAQVTVTNGLTVTSTNPVNGAVDVAANKVIKISFSKPVKFGTKWIELKNSNGTYVPINTSINGNLLTISHPLLAIGTRYTVLLHSGSLTDLAGKGITIFASSFRVSSITLAQMKDGIYRAQNFYNTNNRLPSYVTIGTRKILIAEFLEIAGAYGLKIIY